MGPAPTFDAQAEGFDRRAGLPSPAPSAVADALRELVGPGTLLEIGAGTGELGSEICARGVRYVGLDHSRRMLDAFRARLPEGHPAELHEVDANSTWPVATGSIDVVFGSRSLHLLGAEHVLAEAERVCRTGVVTLVVGRVVRDRESTRERLRRQMRALLAERGVEGRSGHKRRLMQLLEARGATLHAPRATARWTVSATPRDSLASWRGKAGLDMVALPEATKAAILAELESWAGAEFGSLDVSVTSEEAYELETAVLARAP